MNSDNKSKLNILCHSLFKETPYYMTVNHIEYNFKTSLKINEYKVNSDEIKFNKKKDAEQNAAGKMIKLLKNKEKEFFTESVEKSTEFDKSVMFYIDLENMSDINLNKIGQYKAFCSTISPLKIKATDITKNVHKNSADYLLLIQVTEDILMKKYTKYRVLTKDKELYTFIEILKEKYPDVDLTIDC